MGVLSHRIYYQDLLSGFTIAIAVRSLVPCIIQSIFYGRALTGITIPKDWAIEGVL